MAPGDDMRVVHRLAAIFTVAVICSCATVDTRQSGLVSENITIEMLLDSSPLAAGFELKDLSKIDMLELSPEMIDFVDGKVDMGLSPHSRLNELLFAVMGEDTFELVYDDTTRTAQQTFRERHGNCMSFTNMFVAMARHAGLDASYQEVEIPPDWSFTGQAFLLSQHINVLVDFRHYSPRVVDFNISYEPGITYEFNMIYERQVVSDSRARAHYFNNIGAEHMLLGGDTRLALANFRESIRADETFSPAWINLGILYRRDGYVEYAEAALLQALIFDSSSLVAMSNLANLFEDEGRVQSADYYRKQVRAHRMRNPYYRFHLAQSDVINGDYAAARGHLRFAIKRRENEDRFYFLMGVSYALSGDQDAAEEWIVKAKEFASDSDKRNYQNKIDRLMSREPDG
jgi:Flp pilus assembly protein TadD